MESDTTLNDSLNVLAKFALTHTGVIKKISRMMNYNDEPKIFTYITDYETNNNNCSHSSSGTSFNKKRALVKVLGEAIERYCLNHVDEENLIAASTSTLHTPYLDPFRIPSFSKNQLSKKSFRSFIFSKITEFRWVEGYSYTKQRRVLIPAQLIYTNYTPLFNEPYIRFPISTGAAAHSSFNKALYPGLSEIIERAAFMIHYLN